MIQSVVLIMKSLICFGCSYSEAKQVEFFFLSVGMIREAGRK